MSVFYSKEIYCVYLHEYMYGCLFTFNFINRKTSFLCFEKADFSNWTKKNEKKLFCMLLQCLIIYSRLYLFILYIPLLWSNLHMSLSKSPYIIHVFISNLVLSRCQYTLMQQSRVQGQRKCKALSIPSTFTFWKL